MQNSRATWNPQELMKSSLQKHCFVNIPESKVMYFSLGFRLHRCTDIWEFSWTMPRILSAIQRRKKWTSQNLIITLSIYHPSLQLRKFELKKDLWLSQSPCFSKAKQTAQVRWWRSVPFLPSETCVFSCNDLVLFLKAVPLTLMPIPQGIIFSQDYTSLSVIPFWLHVSGWESINYPGYHYCFYLNKCYIWNSQLAFCFDILPWSKIACCINFISLTVESLLQR